MARDLVTLYNLALSAIGTRARVAHPNETSREADICRLWYETVRDKILSAAPWGSCQASAALALKAQQDFADAWAAGDPEPPWIYQYTLPADHLYPRYLDSYETFRLGDAAGVPVLHTNAYAPVLTYTRKDVPASSWSADLWMAMIHGLAGFIAMPLHGKPSRAQSSLDLANRMILEARVQAGNENVTEFDSVPDWLLARGVTSSITPSRYIYPNGPLLSIGTI